MSKAPAATLAILVIFAVLAGCGTSSTANPNSVTGNWSVTLFNSSNTAVYAFTTKLNQQVASPATSSPVTGSDLNLTAKNAACFDASSSSKQDGVYTVSDNFNGLTANTLQLMIDGSPGVLSMKGTFTTSGISGPWSLTTTGTGCDLTGTFLATRI